MINDGLSLYDILPTTWYFGKREGSQNAITRFLNPLGGATPISGAIKFGITIAGN